jgi:hypothetical protein
VTKSPTGHASEELRSGWPSLPTIACAGNRLLASFMSMKSYWTVSPKLPKFPRLAKDLKVDVVVVGGGITGMTAAYLLKGTVPQALFWDTLDPYHYLRVDDRPRHDYLIVWGRGP